MNRNPRKGLNTVNTRTMEKAIITLGALIFLTWILDQEIKLKAYRRQMQQHPATGLALACKRTAEAFKRLGTAMSGYDENIKL